MTEKLKQRFDGRFLHDLRVANDLTLDALAKAVGTSKGYMWELENGVTEKPSFEVVAKLAFVLDVKMEAFIIPRCTYDHQKRHKKTIERKLPTLRTMRILRELK